MEVALVQTMLHWEDPDANRNHLASFLSSLSGQADLIVLPEMFTTGFTMAPEHIAAAEARLTLDWMREWAKQADAALVGSLVWPEGEAFRNRLVFMMPDGAYATYDKRHTFTLAGEDRVYERGSQRLLVPFRGFTFCPLIWYDLRFPVWSRYTEPYDVLIYVANWPEVRISAWDTLLRARAIENMAYVLGVNRLGGDPNGHRYPGHSAAYDALGTALAFSGKEEVLRVRLSRNHLEETRSKLRFLDDRDSFTPGW